MGLYCVADPQGNLVFTCISTQQADAIEQFLHDEQVQIDLYNLAQPLHGKRRKPKASWEHLEAEGYSVVHVVLLPAETNTQDRMAK